MPGLPGSPKLLKFKWKTISRREIGTADQEIPTGAAGNYVPGMAGNAGSRPGRAPGRAAGKKRGPRSATGALETMEREGKRQVHDMARYGDCTKAHLLLSLRCMYGLEK